MSGRMILNLAVSLDGFIADIDGGYDWIAPSGKQELNTDAIYSHEKFLETISAVIMGKTSYRQNLHSEYTGKQIYVVTSKKLQDYDHVHFISGDVCQEVKTLAEKTSGDVYLFGGGVSIDPLLKAGFIDEYIVGIIPIILGKGIPLFLQDNPTIPLHLINYYVEDGIVILQYILRNSMA